MILSAHFTVQQNMSHDVMLLCLYTVIFSEYLQAGQAKVQMKSEKVGHTTWSTASLPLCSFMAVTIVGRHGVHRGSLTCNRKMAATLYAIS